MDDPPGRVSQVLHHVILPNPERWDDFGTLLQALQSEEGGPNIGTLMATSAASSLSLGGVRSITPEVRNIWLIFLSVMFGVVALCIGACKLILLCARDPGFLDQRLYEGKSRLLRTTSSRPLDRSLRHPPRQGWAGGRVQGWEG